VLTQSELVFGLGLPGLVGAVLFLLARASSDTHPRDAGAGRDASPFALALGYLTAQTAVWGQPAIPPVEATQWLWFALLGLVVLSAVFELRSAGAWRFYTPLASVAIVLPAFWLLVRPLAENAWSGRETALWLCGIGVAAVATTFALGHLLDRRPGPWSSVGIVLVIAGSGIVLLLSGTKTYAQLAGAAAAALVPGVLLALAGRGRTFSGHIVPGFVLLLGGLLLAGHQYASLTPLNALLLLVAPLGLWLGELPTVTRWRSWQRGLVALAAVGLPVFLAAGLAARKFLEDTASSY
jgi:hypothetical protein